MQGGAQRHRLTRFLDTTILPILLLLLFAPCPAAAFTPLAPTAAAGAASVQALAAAAAACGAADAGGEGRAKPLVVVIGDRSTRLYQDLWAPGSVSVLEPEDQRLFEVRTRYDVISFD